MAVQFIRAARNEAVMPRQRGGLRSIRDAEFVGDGADVIPYGAFGEGEPVCNIRVRQTTCDVAQNGEFSPAQLSEDGCIGLDLLPRKGEQLVGNGWIDVRPAFDGCAGYPRHPGENGSSSSPLVIIVKSIQNRNSTQRAVTWWKQECRR